MKASTALLTVKLVHTAVWLFFVACIVAIPLAARLQRFEWAVAMSAAVLLETLVLLVNRWSCPLTGIAARYTEARRANFDIFLPLWLARNNKLIFGTLYVCGVAYAAVLWLRQAGLD